MLLPACGGNDSGGSGSTGQNPADLQGKSWVVTQILDADGNTVSAQGINAEFDGSNVSGAVACNTYHATYTATGNEITVGAISTTRAACSPDQDALASQYLKLLGEAATYDIEGRSMSIANGDGTPTIQFSQG
jgi:heat shock protein HslJ